MGLDIDLGWLIVIVWVDVSVLGLPLGGKSLLVGGVVR